MSIIRENSFVQLSIIHVLVFLFAIGSETRFLMNFQTFSPFQLKLARNDVTKDRYNPFFDQSPSMDYFHVAKFIIFYL